MKKKQLIVKQLIELLQEQPQDVLVEIEGCDCVGEATGVSFCTSFNEHTVMILRLDGWYQEPKTAFEALNQ